MAVEGLPSSPTVHPKSLRAPNSSSSRLSCKAELFPMLRLVCCASVAIILVIILVVCYIYFTYFLQSGLWAGAPGYISGLCSCPQRCCCTAPRKGRATSKSMKCYGYDMLWLWNAKWNVEGSKFSAVYVSLFLSMWKCLTGLLVGGNPKMWCPQNHLLIFDHVNCRQSHCKKHCSSGNRNNKIFVFTCIKCCILMCIYTP